jgi:uncharacterized protein
MRWRLKDMYGSVNIEIRRYYALMILGIVLPFLLSPFLAMVFGSPTQSFTYRLTLSRFLIWGTLGLVFLYARQAEVQKFLLWDEKRCSLKFYISSIVVLFLVLFADGIIAHIPYWLGLREKNVMMHKMDQSMREYPVLLVFTAFTAGITEEFIFRGYMISRLSLLFRNKYLPIVISALLFAAIHLGYKSAGELIFTFLFGIIFGYHYQKYRNIKVLMIVHFLWDLMVTMPALHRR